MLRLARLASHSRYILKPLKPTQSLSIVSELYRRPTLLHKALFSTRNADAVSFNFALSNGNTVNVDAKVGDSLLDVVVDNSLDIDGFGACEGTLACSTCHVILTPEQYAKVTDGEPCDEELDMLDLAFGLTDTSRLGCQIKVTKEMEGWTINVPEQTLDARITS